MAAIWDTKLNRFVVTGTYKGNIINNLNTREYENVYIHQSFKIKLEGYAPNTSYTLRCRRAGMNANYFGNNQGWNDCCTEEDITNFFWYDNNSDYLSKGFTTNAVGEAELIIVPNNSWVAWSWSSFGLGFPDGGSPVNGDNVRTTLNNTGFKGSRGWGTTDKCVAAWDSISRYNPVPLGYQRLESEIGDRYFTLFDRTASFRFFVDGVSGETTVNAFYPLAYQVGAGDYPQNEWNDYTDPQLDIDFTMSPEDSVVEWLPFIKTDIRVDKAIIPYNKTTEREVVHLDYRIKSTD